LVRHPFAEQGGAVVLRGVVAETPWNHAHPGCPLVVHFVRADPMQDWHRRVTA